MKNRNQAVILCITLLLLPTILMVNFFIIPVYFREYTPLKRHSFSIQRAYVISLYPESMGELLSSIQLFLQIPNATVVQAVNGSQAIRSGALQDLSLYTQYLMFSGFHPLTFFKIMRGNLSP